ncbi:MAG: 23S rRNA (pseudouridine(1915)-N(3))-methyltransferase RlmH [Chlamydiia bacterium]|nr:23S rRNA (pseudouridine(1915)-N(3))-methyltransferase RlmH [Chlamydiia bacterium]
MLSVTILSVGKNKEPWLESALADYQQRLRGRLELSSLWVKDDSALCKACERFSEILLLDPHGKAMDSPGFADLLREGLERGGSRLCIVIGGAEGLPAELRSRYPMLSLSRLTFTHQIARLILTEQLYRAVEIWRGSPYHK